MLQYLAILFFSIFFPGVVFEHFFLVVSASRQKRLSQLQEFVRDCGMAIRSEEKMSSRHFKNWIRLLATLMSMDLSVILFQWCLKLLLRLGTVDG